MRYGDAGAALGVHPNSLRYASLTGTVLIRWEGARQPTIWTAPPPQIGAGEARVELARRYLHAFGPSAAESFARWGGIGRPEAQAAFDTLASELLVVRTPLGEAAILAEDEAAFREPASPTEAVRLLPSGDPYYLLWGADRELLVPDAAHRDLLWTSRVWPGAVLVGGEIVGTWRRAEAMVVVTPWQRLTPSERDALEGEAATLPLPDVAARGAIRWDESGVG